MSDGSNERNTLANIAGAAGLTGLAVALLEMLVRQDTSWITWTALGVGALGIVVYVIVDARFLLAFFRSRQARYGTNVAVAGLIVLAILAVLNYIAAAQDTRWDLTERGLNTLSDQTLKELGRLHQDVEVIVFQPETEGVGAFEEINDLLALYARHSPKFKYQIVDPYKEPVLAKEHEITEASARIVMKAGDLDTRVPDYTEEAVTNGLIRVTTTDRKKIYVVGGHGEPSFNDPGPAGFKLASEAIRSEGFDVAELQLVTLNSAPPDASLIVIAGATKPLLEPEVAVMEEYLRRGGHMLLLLEMRTRTGLEELLARWGVKVNDDLVVDEMSRVYSMGAAVPVISHYADHPITRNIGAFSLMPTTRSIEAGGAGRRRTAEVLASAGPTSMAASELAADGSVDPDKARRGPIPVAALAYGDVRADGLGGKEKFSDQTRMVVIGDHDFVSNQGLHLGANRDLLLNTVNWLAEREDRISIRPRQRDVSRLFLTTAEQRMLSIGSQWVLPLLMLVLGTATFMRKRWG